MQKSGLTEIASKAFDLSDTSEYTMSIRFIPGGFCFIVYARKDGGLLYFMEVAEPGNSSAEVLRERAASHPVLKSAFHQVQFIAGGGSACELMPTDIFQEEDARAVWRLTHGEVPETSSLHCDLLKVLGVNLAYLVPKDLEQTVRSTYPNVRFVCRQSVLVQTAVMANRKNAAANLFLNLSKGLVDAVVVLEGKLQMVNSFAYRNCEEFLYFVLGVCDLFGLDQYKSEVSLSGDLDGELVAAMRRYMKCVHPLSPLPLTDEFADITAPERHLSLFNIPVCAL